MNLKPIGLIVAILLLSHQTGFSQIRPHNVRLSLYNEALTLPTIKVFKGPIHPGIMLGTDLCTKSVNHWRMALGTDLGFYNHKFNENAAMLDLAFALGYKFDFGLTPKITSAIGYKHAFFPSEAYQYKDGVYKKSPNLGTGSATFKLGLGLEFAITEKMSVTADYKMMISAPYSETLKFSLNSFIGLGAVLNLPDKKEKK